MLKRTGKNIGVASIVLKAILIYLITVFILYPNINLLINVFYKNGSFSTQAFSKIIKSQRALKSMTNSFVLAVSMIVTVNITNFLCFSNRILENSRRKDIKIGLYEFACLRRRNACDRL